MPVTTPRTAFHALLYGGAAMLLLFDAFFLLKALFFTNYVPLVPIIIGIFVAAGLLFIVRAEQHAREADKRDHRRISRVAHQLENPLHTLQADLEALLARADSLPAEERLKLKRMETKTKVLLENIRDVFLMLQADEHPLSQEPRVYNLCVLVEEVISRQQKLAGAHNVELLHKAHCSDAPVRVDRQLFIIALTHILENAILYTLTPGLVNVAITRGKKHARVIIQDRGLGVATSDRLAIFQPFARGARAEQYDPDGIGVGLTLARHIIREFKGDIRWRNREPGTGAEFEIVLPLAKS